MAYEYPTRFVTDEELKTVCRILGLKYSNIYDKDYKIIKHYVYIDPIYLESTNKRGEKKE